MSTEIIGENYPIGEVAPRGGQILLVDKTVEDTVDSSIVTNEAFGELLTRLEEQIPGESVTNRYHRAQRYSQATTAAMSFLALGDAMPAMLDHYETHGTLIPPDDLPFEPYDYLGEEVPNPYPEPYRKALRGVFWLVRSAEQLESAIKDVRHPYHSLYKHYIDSRNQRNETQRAWKQLPGNEKRWPAYVQEGVPAPALFFALNVKLGVDFMAAKLLHHTLYVNSQPGSVELSRATRGAVAPLNRVTTTDRHLDWSADWQTKWEAGFPQGALPLDVGLQVARMAIGQSLPDNYLHKLLEFRLMASPDFCPHPSIREGSRKNVRMCAGAVLSRYSEETDKNNVSSLAAILGYRLEKGARFNLGSIALAIASSLVETTMQPAWLQTLASDDGPPALRTLLEG